MYLIFDTETTGLPKRWDAPITDTDNWPRCIQIDWQLHDEMGNCIEHEDYLCMAFRGTDEIKDWLDNLNAFSEAHLFGEFHRGFWNSLEDVWQGMNAAYQEKRAQKARPLFITGHSLGGAMASVATAKFIHEDLPFTSVYTFGQPRAMDRKTAQIFNINTYD